MLSRTLTAWKVLVFGVFWSVFSHIWTEYREILHIYPYSVQMRKNTDQTNPNTDTFHAVTFLDFVDISSWHLKWVWLVFFCSVLFCFLHPISFLKVCKLFKSHIVPQIFCAYASCLCLSIVRETLSRNFYIVISSAWGWKKSRWKKVLEKVAHINPF